MKKVKRKYSKRKKNNNAKLILFMIVVCIIILIVTICLLVNAKKSESDNNVTNVLTEAESDEQYIRPDETYIMDKEKFFSELSEYVSTVSEDEVMEVITDYIYYLLDNKDELINLDDEAIEIYYESDQETYLKMGIIDYYELKNIVDVLRNIEIDSSVNNLELSYLEFDMDTFTQTEAGIDVTINIKFTYVEEIYTVQLGILDSTEEDYQISLTSLMTE